MVKIKIGFSGPPCSGKTTTVHEVVVELRKLGIKADVLSGIERTPIYDIKRMKNINEHNISLMNHVLQESLHMRRPDIDVILVDRTVLDIWIDLDVSAKVGHYGRSKSIKEAMRGYINSWLETYDLIFKFNELPFKDDGLRLNNMKWRDELIKYYKKFNIDNEDSSKNIVSLTDINISFICNSIIKKLEEIPE